MSLQDCNFDCTPLPHAVLNPEQTAVQPPELSMLGFLISSFTLRHIYTALAHADCIHSTTMTDKVSMMLRNAIVKTVILVGLRGMHKTGCPGETS